MVTAVQCCIIFILDNKSPCVHLWNNELPFPIKKKKKSPKAMNAVLHSDFLSVYASLCVPLAYSTAGPPSSPVVFFLHHLTRSYRFPFVSPPVTSLSSSSLPCPSHLVWKCSRPPLPPPPPLSLFVYLASSWGLSSAPKGEVGCLGNLSVSKLLSWPPLYDVTCIFGGPIIRW